MATELYKKGEGRTIRGLECEVLRVEPRFFNGTPPEGYFFSPEEAHEEAKTKEESKTEEAEKETNEIDILTCNHAVRKAAEKAGIEDFDTARITTLKRKLKA